MFSNDQNIETIAQLTGAIKRYLGLQTEYVKLDVIEKTVKLFTAITLFVVISLIAVLVTIFLSFALAFAIAPLIGTALAFVVVALIYIAILAVVVVNRKRWIEAPVVRFLANMLMEK